MKENCWAVKSKNFRRAKEFSNYLAPNSLILQRREPKPKESESPKVRELDHARQRQPPPAFLPYDLGAASWVPSGTRGLGPRREMRGERTEAGISTPYLHAET